MPEDVNRKQAFFRSMLVGILLYSVVLGFFNDYTEILHTGSYSVTFAVAIVMQVLTYLTFAAKDFAVSWFRRRGGPKHKVGIVVSVWLIMFLSKFVFLAAIAVVFQGSVQVSGFVGLLVVIACMTVAQRLVEIVDQKLGGQNPIPAPFDRP
ncbi:MAG: hypothetical protein ABWZ98_02085 [Nakamurella sp.]